MSPPSPAIRHLDAIRSLAPLVAEARVSFDRDRRLPEHIIAGLAEAGLFRLWLPKALDGPQLSPLEFMTVVEAAAALDGSIGWLVGNGGGMSRAAAFVTERTARSWFADPRAFIAAATGATGEATPVEDGYRVSGRWPFGSGAHHATLFMGLAELKTEGDEKQQISCYMPREAIVLDDTWHVSGLRGTGSCHFEARDLFVPFDHTHDFMAPSPQQPGAIYRLPVISMFAWTIAAVPLGVARGAIDTFIDLARNRRRQGGSVTLCERETVQSVVGRADTICRGARLLLIQAMSELLEFAEQGHEPPLKVRATLRAAATHAAETALEIVRLLTREAGAISIFESCTLERAARDIHAASQHLAISPNNYAVLGRIDLGLDPALPRV
jgi:alkylation response protein AidB-like acyl-CoA dehydrogenase